METQRIGENTAEVTEEDDHEDENTPRREHDNPKKT